MRLIDADELINQGYEIVVDGWQYDTCNKSIDIDTIPTAYDVDKVVKELETNKQNALEVEESIKEYNVWNKAIEIVKQWNDQTYVVGRNGRAVKGRWRE